MLSVPLKTDVLYRKGPDETADSFQLPKPELCPPALPSLVRLFQQRMGADRGVVCRAHVPEAAHAAMSTHFPGVELLKVAEVAETLRVSRMTVYRMVNSGELPSVHVGRTVRIHAAAVEDYLPDITDDEENR